MPDIRLYQSALQHPERCFTDEELKTATVVKMNGGWMPLAWAGQFAVVFKLETANGPRAVRCFYHPRTEHEDRYKLFHEHLQGRSLNCLTRFDYLPEGILLDGASYPIVKMEWVEGVTLDKRVEALVEKRAVDGLEKLSLAWHEAARGLRQASIAHGDMQHGNILSQNGSLRLVDYDGVFIPSFQGKKPLETGHRNYQHPDRSQSASFGLHIDHFSSFVIYLSIKALAADPKLWRTFHQDDYLILKQDDYTAPHKSLALKTLKRSSDLQIRELANKLEEICVRRVEEVPPFDALVGGSKGGPAQATAGAATLPGTPWWDGLKEVHPVSGPAAAATTPASSAEGSLVASRPPAPPPAAPLEPPRQGPARSRRIAMLIFWLLLFAACSTFCLVLAANIN